MIEPEELADAPEYKWRRWWAKASLPTTAILFMMVLAFTGNVFIAAIAAGVVYVAVASKVRELDAPKQGAPSRDFDAIVQAALERRRMEEGQAPTVPTERPTTPAEPSPPRSARAATPGFGRATPKASDPSSPRKPVQLPRHRG